MDLKNLMYEVDLYCPEFHVEGNYDIHGTLLDKPIEGNGKFTVDTKAYELKVIMDVSLTNKADKQYLYINNFNVEATALDDLVFDFKNLFNGQKEKFNNLLQYINENSKAVASILQGPLFRDKFKKLVDLGNNFLKVQPLQNFFIM